VTFLDRQHFAVREWKEGRDATCAHDQQPPRIGPPQPGRSQCRRGRGSTGSDLIAVDLCQWLPGARVVERIGREQARQAQGRIAGKDVDGLDAEVVVGLPRRHDQHGALAAVGGCHNVRVAQQHIATLDEHSRDGIDQAAEGQRISCRGSVEGLHAGPS